MTLDMHLAKGDDVLCGADWKRRPWEARSRVPADVTCPACKVAMQQNVGLPLTTKVYLVWYTSPEQLEPDEPQLESIHLTRLGADTAASGSHWHRVEEREVVP